MTDDLSDAMRDDAADLLNTVERTGKQTRESIHPNGLSVGLVVIAQGLASGVAAHGDRVIVLPVLALLAALMVNRYRHRRRLGVAVHAANWIVTAVVFVADIVVYHAIDNDNVQGLWILGIFLGALATLFAINRYANRAPVEAQ